MVEAVFEFEKPIATLEKKLQDLRELSGQDQVDLTKEIASLEKKLSGLIEETFAKLSPWQRVQLSRHPSRPYTADYVESLFPTFLELHGDRTFAEDRALMVGFAHWFDDPDQSVLIMGHQKGRSTKQKMERNFGMAKPEGYRKAIRLMDLANRMHIPILSFIDTPGAYPGIETEERGQAQAIAECIQHMFTLDVPVCSVVIGEGGSGGALAVGIGNVVLMQEYSTYSVISPEGCASILWSDSKLAERAADGLKLSATDLLQHKVIDGIIPEPPGGAHRDPALASRLLREGLVQHFGPWIYPKVKSSKSKSAASSSLTPKDHRLQKFRHMGEHAIGHAL